MHHLFYSANEGIAFYIPNYYPDKDNVSEQIKMLEEERLKFARAIGKGRLDDIGSYCIQKSRRYKSMRVFYCQWDECPKDAFSIGFKSKGNEKEMKDEKGETVYQWTMHDWIHD